MSGRRGSSQDTSTLDTRHRSGPGASPPGASVSRIGFADRATISEITKFDPPRAWTVKSIDGPVRAQVQVTVDPLGAQRSRLSIAIDFEGHGFGRVIVALFVVREARREMPDNLAKLGQRMLASADG